tara:strand:+ start:72 stop:557 length:486 start_codon:yes stop_codon:yes gene_type:complete
MTGLFAYFIYDDYIYIIICTVRCHPGDRQAIIKEIPHGFHALLSHDDPDRTVMVSVNKGKTIPIKISLIEVLSSKHVGEWSLTNPPPSVDWIKFEKNRKKKEKMMKKMKVKQKQKKKSLATMVIKKIGGNMEEEEVRAEWLLGSVDLGDMERWCRYLYFVL